MKKKMYMIGNAHLDAVWMWDWKEGYQENLATIRSALDRLDEFKDAVFTSSSAQFYEWIEEVEPELMERIKQYIRDGRWVICGGWWIQPDCNLPGEESYARHALIAQTYFKTKLETTAKVGYCVDSFGHNANMPALLKNSGMTAYVFMRPGPQEKELPGRNFIWESEDGSRIAAFRIPFSYCTFDDLEEHIEKCSKEFDVYSNSCMCFYGVGNHGGGPTIQNLNIIKEKTKQMSERIVLELSDPEQYFKDTKEEQKYWPIYKGDLHHHASGCYSVLSKMKEWNRKTEQEILRAEKFGVLEHILLCTRQDEDFNRAWKNLLFNQFHDTLAGTAIERAYEQVYWQLGESRAIAERYENRALQRIASKICIPKKDHMLPVVIFNPHSFPIEQVVECEQGFFLNEPFQQQLIVENSVGDSVDYQFVETEAKVPRRNRIAFRATVPAFGYETYFISPCKTHSSTADEEKKARYILENETLRVKFDEYSGYVLSIYDKVCDIEYCRSAFASWAVIEDEGDTWAHEIVKFDGISGEPILEYIGIVEEGKVRTTMLVKWTYKSSLLEQRFTLENGSSKLQVSCKIDWREEKTCLKLCFPLNLEKCIWRTQIPFGSSIQNMNGEEYPMLGFCDVSGEEKGRKAGILFATDSKYAGDMQMECFRMTVLRSPGYAHHHPYVCQEFEEISYIDMGIQKFKYAVIPYMGEWNGTRAAEEAAILNQPVSVVRQSFQDGVLPQRYQGMQCDCNNIVVSAVKRAENNKGYIIRLYESAGSQAKGMLEIQGLIEQYPINLEPYEICTLFIEDSTNKIEKVNFLELKINE